MTKLFLNISNHPSDKWSEEQLAATKVLGCSIIIDIAFPNVEPTMTFKGIQVMAEAFAEKHIFWRDEECVVHVMGEMGLTYALVTTLLQQDIQVVHSTTERVVTEVQKEGITEKKTTFRFVQFRSY